MFISTFEVELVPASSLSLLPTFLLLGGAYISSSGNVAQQLKGTSSPRSENSVIMFSNSDADIKSGEVS